MPQLNIAGQEVMQDNANEGIKLLAENKTLIIEKLTNEAPTTSEIVKGLKNMTEVFQHFNPKVNIEFTNEDGAPVEEQMSFHNLGNFGKKGLTQQSEFLQNLDAQAQDFLKFMRMLKAVKPLQSLLQDPDAKAAYLAGIEAMIAELEATEG